MSFAKCMSNIQASATVAAFARAGELKRQGVDLISLVAGEPDFDTPEHIQDAGIEAIRTGKTKYTNHTASKSYPIQIKTTEMATE